MAMPFSGRLQGAGKTALWNFENYFIVTEENATTVAGVLARMAGSANNPIPLQYRYAGSVFYKLSRNPVGPSKLPLLVLGLEHSNISSTYAKQGLLDRIMRKAPVPTHLHVGYFVNDERVRLGMIPNSVEDGSGHRLVVQLVASAAGLELPADLTPVFTDMAWDHDITH
jgi:hypothetical protein